MYVDREFKKQLTYEENSAKSFRFVTCHLVRDSTLSLDPKLGMTSQNPIQRHMDPESEE